MREEPDTERPRERLLRHGPAPMMDAELLALVLGSGTRAANAFAIALTLLAAFGGLPRLAAAGVAEIAAVPGVGFAQACRLKAALSLAGRVSSRPMSRGDPFSGPRQVAERLGKRLLLLEREVFIGVALDVKNRVLVESQLAAGSVCSVDVVPRDAFTFAVREAAASVVFVHNHPSGDPRPSGDDRALTAHLAALGTSLGIRVLDHVIVAQSGFHSVIHDTGEAWA